MVCSSARNRVAAARSRRRDIETKMPGTQQNAASTAPRRRGRLVTYTWRRRLGAAGRSRWNRERNRRETRPSNERRGRTLIRFSATKSASFTERDASSARTTSTGWCVVTLYVVVTSFVTLTNSVTCENQSVSRSGDAPRQFDLCTVRGIHGRVKRHVVGLVERDVVCNVAEHVVSHVYRSVEKYGFVDEDRDVLRRRDVF